MIGVSLCNQAYSYGKKPEYFILENVPGLKTIDNGKTFELILSMRKT